MLAETGNGAFDDSDSLNDPYFNNFPGDFTDPGFGYPGLGASHLDIQPTYSAPAGRGAQQYGGSQSYHNSVGLQHDHLDTYGAPSVA